MKRSSTIECTDRKRQRVFRRSRSQRTKETIVIVSRFFFCTFEVTRSRDLFTPSRRGRIASGIFENYALPDKRGRANGHDSFEKLISCGNPRNSHVINPWHTDSFSSARWERSADRSVELDAGIEVKAHMQYGRKLARSASQVRLFDRISLGRGGRSRRRSDRFLYATRHLP